MLNYSYLKKHDCKYDSKVVEQFVVLIKTTKSESAKTKLKRILFIKVGRVIIKNIENFFYLIKDSDRECLHTKDDLISECYMSMELCLKRYNPDFKAFQWFLNKALSRMLFRLADKEYNKNSKIFALPEGFDVRDDQKESDFSTFYMKQLKMTFLERRLVRSKMKGEKVDEFRKNNGNLTTIRYYELLNSVKTKLKPLQDEHNSDFT